jgi:hypothetical protein
VLVVHPVLVEERRVLVHFAPQLAGRRVIMLAELRMCHAPVGWAAQQQVET